MAKTILLSDICAFGNIYVYALKKKYEVIVEKCRIRHNLTF